MGGRGSVAFEFAVETEAGRMGGAEDLFSVLGWRRVRRIKRGRGMERGRKRTYDFVDILCDSVAQGVDVALDGLHEDADVGLHLLGREAELAHRGPDHAKLLAVLGRADHGLDQAIDVARDRPQLGAGHQPARPQDLSQAGLVELGGRVDVTQQPLEVDFSLADLVEQLLFAAHGGANCLGGRGER